MLTGPLFAPMGPAPEAPQLSVGAFSLCGSRVAEALTRAADRTEVDPPNRKGCAWSLTMFAALGP